MVHHSRFTLASYPLHKLSRTKTNHFRNPLRGTFAEVNGKTKRSSPSKINTRTFRTTLFEGFDFPSKLTKLIHPGLLNAKLQAKPQRTLRGNSQRPRPAHQPSHPPEGTPNQPKEASKTPDLMSPLSPHTLENWPKHPSKLFILKPPSRIMLTPD